MPTPPPAEPAKRRWRAESDPGPGSSERSQRIPGGVPGWATWAAIPPAVGLSVLVASAGGSLGVLAFMAGGIAAVLLAGLVFFRFFSFVLAVLMLRPVLDVVTTSQVARAVEPSSLLTLAFAGTAVLWLAARSRTGLVKTSPVRTALLVLLVVGLLSTIGSARPGTSLAALIQLGFWALMFVVLDELLESRRDILQLLGAVGLSSVVPLVAGIAGAASDAGPLVETKGTLLRVTSTFDSSNEFGRYLMLLLLMAWAVQAFLPRTQRAVVLAGTVPATALLVLTYTRSAWLGLVVGLVVIGALQSRRVLAGLITVTAVLLVAVPPVSDRIFTTASPYENAGGSISWRLSYWQEVLPLVGQNPVTGIGLNVTSFQTVQGAAPHNDYLRFLVETGVVGLAAYLAFLAALVVTAARAVRRRPQGLTRGLGVGFGACVGATLVASAGANLILNVAFMWYLMAFAAAVTCALRLEADAEETAADTTGAGISPPRAEGTRE